jgi:hypothetical protein
VIELDKDTRTFLTRKLMCTCPLCKRPIYGGDIDITNIDISKIDSWPMAYVHCHSHKDHPLHALTIYIDANFATRGKEVSPYLKIQT